MMNLLDFVRDKAGTEPWKTLSRPLIVQGEVCELPVGSKTDTCVHYINGERITKTADGYRWESRTVCGGVVEPNFEATFDLEGHVIGGFMNCFGLGRMGIDDGYIEAYGGDAFERDDWKVA